MRKKTEAPESCPECGAPKTGEWDGQTHYDCGSMVDLVGDWVYCIDMETPT